MEDFEIVREISAYYKKQIRDTVIEQLKTLKDKVYLMSGDDSGLRNLWEEICVQVKGEYSFFWDAYENTIDNHIEAELEKLPTCIQNAINYCEVDYTADEDEVGFDQELIIKAIRRDILEVADEYENANIRRYLDRDEGLDGDDEYEDDVTNEKI